MQLALIKDILIEEARHTTITSTGWNTQSFKPNTLPDTWGLKDLNEISGELIRPKTEKF